MATTSGTLVFDDYQMSADIRVPVSSIPQAYPAYITNFTGYIYLNSTNTTNPPPYIGQITTNATTYVTPVVFTNYSTDLDYTNSYVTTNNFTYITNFTGYYLISTNAPNPPPSIGQTSTNGATYVTPVVFTNYSTNLDYTTNYATRTFSPISLILRVIFI